MWPWWRNRFERFAMSSETCITSVFIVLFAPKFKYFRSVNYPISIKLYMYDNSPALNPFTCWNLAILTVPPPGDRKWANSDMCRTLTNSYRFYECHEIAYVVDTLQTSGMKSYQNLSFWIDSVGMTGLPFWVSRCEKGNAYNFNVHCCI